MPKAVVFSFLSCFKQSEEVARVLSNMDIRRRRWMFYMTWLEYQSLAAVHSGNDHVHDTAYVLSIFSLGSCKRPAIWLACNVQLAHELMPGQQTTVNCTATSTQPDM